MRGILKYTLYALLYLTVFAMQSALAPLFLPLGAAPELLPLLTACTAVYEEICPAALLGLFAGCLHGTLSGGFWFSVLFFYFASAAVSAIRRTYFRPVSGVCLLAALALCLLADALPYFGYALPFLHASALRAGIALGLHEGYALVCFFPLHAICARISRIAPRKEARV